jgi:hypothetical protein
MREKAKLEVPSDNLRIPVSRTDLVEKLDETQVIARKYAADVVISVRTGTERSNPGRRSTT